MSKTPTLSLTERTKKPILLISIAKYQKIPHSKPCGLESDTSECFKVWPSMQTSKWQDLTLNKKSGERKLADGNSSKNNNGESNSTGLFVSSIGKAFTVLETFSEPNTELKLTEVAERTNVGRSAAQRILFTLSSIGYLVQNEQTRSYRLSPKLLRLAQSYSSIEEIKSKARDHLARLNHESEETVNLTVLDDTEIVYVERYPSKHIVSVNLEVGTRLPAYCTAPGKVFLANISKSRANTILARSNLEPKTGMTEVNRQKIDEALDDVRKNGYAISNQEAFVGDISVAAPIFDRSGAVVAAVNVAVAYPRWTLEQAEVRLVPLIKETAARISSSIVDSQEKPD